MDEKRKKTKFWGWLLLTGAIILPLFLLFVNRLFMSPKVTAALVQHAVTRTEKEINNLIDNNSDYYQYEKANIGLFVYHNDSLLYWNNNLIGPKLIKRKVEVGNDTICNLLTGDYYVKSFQKGNLNYYVFKLLNTTYQLENQYFKNQFQPFQQRINAKTNFSEKGFAIYSSTGKHLSNCEIKPTKTFGSITWTLLLIIEVMLVTNALIILIPKRKNKRKGKTRIKMEWGVGAILIIAITLTYFYYQRDKQLENNEMQVLAEHLLTKRDTNFETAYLTFAEELKSDTTLNSMIFAESNIISDVVLGYSKELLFGKDMQDYDVTLTVCAPDEEITVQPDDYVTDCDDYFNEKLANNKQNKVGDNLYFIDYYTLDPNYLGKISINSTDSIQQRTLYFEFYKPIAPEGFGFPQLLQEEHSEKPYDYSVANYRDNVLVYKYGKYIYPNFFTDQKGRNHEFNTAQGYKHYTLKKDENNILVISTLRKGWAEITAPFAIFFLALLLPYLLVCWTAKPKEQRQQKKDSFRQKLQRLVLYTLGISFLAIGPISVFYMKSLYNQKTLDTEFETTRTLANELSNDIDMETLLPTANRETWTNILQHYASTFFTDLNLYSLDGQLIATTRQEIYELALQGPIMNAVAYQNMHRNKALYYTHEEYLGKGSYQSAYVPLTDCKGNTLAYLNTPYFSSATELQKEILNFILTYTNIILILLALSLLLVLSITKNLTRPLALLQEGIDKMKIDQKNEPIEWNSNDEIGELVKQYNQLIVKLEESANELKRTTTERAWRDVARQVAHEIKNSLTPMRLSVQMLQRSMEKGDADIDEKVRRTSATLIEQIDALSDIASSFSSYAKLPENHPAPLDLAELIQNVVNLYDNADNITFRFDYDPSANHTYNGDKTNLNSAVGNLVKNAVQAIGSKPDGRIEVALKATETDFIISVKDNGKGIKEEDKSRIFLPNFTTKTGGSGVGLSLTYNIVQSAGGTISFESEEGEGATFTIVLPKSN